MQCQSDDRQYSQRLGYPQKLPLNRKLMLL